MGPACSHRTGRTSVRVPEPDPYRAAASLQRGPRGRRTVRAERPSRALRALDRACHLHARGHVELVEDVAQVGLDGLRAEEQRARDLPVGLAVDDEPRDLELACGERSDAGEVRAAAARAPVDALAELAELLLDACPLPDRAEHVEGVRRAAELRRRPVRLAGLGQRTPGESSG